MFWALTGIWWSLIRKCQSMKEPSLPGGENPVGNGWNRCWKRALSSTFPSIGLTMNSPRKSRNCSGLGTNTSRAWTHFSKTSKVKPTRSNTASCYPAFEGVLHVRIVGEPDCEKMLLTSKSRRNPSRISCWCPLRRPWLSSKILSCLHMRLRLLIDC